MDLIDQQVKIESLPTLTVLTVLCFSLTPFLSSHHSDCSRSAHFLLLLACLRLSCPLSTQADMTEQFDEAEEEWEETSGVFVADGMTCDD